MPKPPKASAKKHPSKANSRRERRARPSHATVTKITANKPTGPASKQARVIAMLRSASGTTIAAIMRETGWQQHSVRGFLAGVICKKLGLKLLSSKTDGERVYHIEGEGARTFSQKPSRPLA